MIGPSSKERSGLVAAYTLSDAIWAIVLFVVLVAFLVGGIWLLVALFRNHDVPNWLKGLLLVVSLFLPPAGVVACFAVWIVTRSHHRAAETDPELAEFRSWKAERETTADELLEPAPPDGTPAVSARRLPFPPR
jgi:hypothetical protein